MSSMGNPFLFWHGFDHYEEVVFGIVQQSISIENCTIKELCYCFYFLMVSLWLIRLHVLEKLVIGSLFYSTTQCFSRIMAWS